MFAVTTDDDRDQTELSKLKTDNFITCVPPLGQPRNFPQRFSVSHQGDSLCYRRRWKFRTTSLAILDWIKTSTWIKSLAIFFGLNFRVDLNSRVENFVVGLLFFRQLSLQYDPDLNGGQVKPIQI